jgi:hypothetical protein
MRIILLMTLLGAVEPSGQVAKFDSRKPTAEYIAAAKLEDVERCLIRSGSPPQVYRQPDRVDDVSLVWTAGGVSSGNAAARVDLHRVAAESTKVTSWLSDSVVGPCARR